MKYPKINTLACFAFLSVTLSFNVLADNSASDSANLRKAMVETLEALKLNPSNDRGVPLAPILLGSADEYSQAQPKIKNTPAKTGIVKDSYFVTFLPAKEDGKSFIKRPEKVMRGFSNVPFGMHSNGQSKHEIADSLRLNGEVVAIYDTINTIHVKMNEREARRLAKNKNVKSITPNQYMQTSATQENVEWALDMMDETTIALDQTYDYVFNGAGRTIYVLDSGLDLSVQAVADEFDGRAQVFWDVNGLDGKDCVGHGTQVASAIAGETYGIAKGANLIIAKYRLMSEMFVQVIHHQIQQFWLLIG